ncbi:hypothetical protein CCAN12_800033 [Capnocytophaga canimorsus]|uniref:Uncharacterized protein n=1 Tax=Capnocytophaga canimorsus TaxID=28188 RepID=A0A0B7HMP6_9FLAO|nr:hypothetical protein CCAN12_800033 [Capnocytophaga canimorsus]
MFHSLLFLFYKITDFFILTVKNKKVPKISILGTFSNLT